MSVYQAALDGEDALKALLKSKVSVNNNDMDGNTALHYVSSYGKVEAVEVLLKNGAKVNLQNNRGDTPLHRASSKGHKQVASLFRLSAEAPRPSGIFITWTWCFSR